MKLFLSMALAVAAFGQMVMIPHSPSASDVFLNSRRAYATLTSYSDTGSFHLNFMGTLISALFVSKMARPDSYRVSWTTDRDVKSVVWSAGNGDFIQRPNYPPDTQEEVFQKMHMTETEQQKKAEREAILFSNGDIIPKTVGIFFDIYGRLSPLNPLNDVRPLPDEALSGVDCYVFDGAGGPKDYRVTIWIGKADYFIRQIKEERLGQDHVVATETYTDIVVNQKFSPGDFLHE